ncbi:MAG: hypothetical protein RL497_2976 [Pseudomonadota bacterium]
MSILVVRSIFSGCLLLLSVFALAKEPSASNQKPSTSDQPPKLCQAPCTSGGQWDLSVGFGLGVSTNPLKGGSDIPLLVRPRLSYSGERFFLDNLEAGVILWESPSQQINFLLQPSSEQLYFRRWRVESSLFDDANKNLIADGRPSNNPSSIENNPPSIVGPSTRPSISSLHHRHTSALGGLEYIYTGDSLEFNVQLVQEASGYHSGRELRLAISRDFLEYWRITFGANFQSEDYINYYFGIDEQEATQELPQYAASSGGWSELVRLEYLKPISEHISLRAGAATKVFSSEMSSSPLMDKSRAYSVFIGGVYYF